MKASSFNRLWDAWVGTGTTGDDDTGATTGASNFRYSVTPGAPDKASDNAWWFDKTGKLVMSERDFEVGDILIKKIDGHASYVASTDIRTGARLLDRQGEPIQTVYDIQNRSSHAGWEGTRDNHLSKAERDNIQSSLAKSIPEGNREAVMKALKDIGMGTFRMNTARGGKTDGLGLLDPMGQFGAERITEGTDVLAKIYGKSEKAASDGLLDTTASVRQRRLNRLQKKGL
jgi:hypothetical protein